ncbi:MAG: hypothetical protein HGB19_09140, partial [Chlorobiales bacterium]|nr:hypothetical protein [Chlorobiales bacterium]
MPAENETKIHKISDIADELQVGAQDVLAFIKEQGIKVATSSSKVTDSIREMVLDHYSIEKKKSDLHRKHKEEKQRKTKRTEDSLPSSTEKSSAKKQSTKKQVLTEVEHEETGLFSAQEAKQPEVVEEAQPAVAPEVIVVESEQKHETEVAEVSHADMITNAQPDTVEPDKKETMPVALEAEEVAVHDTKEIETITEVPVSAEQESEAESASK